MLGGVVVGASLVGCATFGSDEPKPSASDASAPSPGPVADASADASGTVPNLDEAPCDGVLACPRVVFVTATPTPGNFGGTAGGDRLCNEAAKASPYRRVARATFTAWLSTSLARARDRVVKGTGRYVSTRGTAIAASFEDLLRDGFAAPVADEAGREVGGNVWTGTDLAGGPTAELCGNWTSTTGTGQAGDAQGVRGRWTAAILELCDRPLRLYCLEN